ncbi:LCP family protein [Pontibacillus yanchengensis]|uniref:Trascriptional regulator n=1 Tax=Pontibacillus yanchengensis Y32 TaxID=1385514 RepID=A0A0A2TKE1_9BACI|nr:LCP family protein [Pontibacillus yanchengensis]KGP74556.1 trascriptional regulator [Pontibacillus yanchengensis Y32]
MKMTRKKKILKRKRVWLIFIILFFSVCGWLFYMYSEVRNTVDSVYTPLEEDGLMGHHDEKSSFQLQDLNPIQRKSGEDIEESLTFLLAGVDERNNDVGRSDALMLVTVNRKKDSMKMVSIPRDTRTEIVGDGRVTKINHSYAYGGMQMTVNTVEQFLDIPIDHYVRVNMEGFQDTIDLLDGVVVKNDFPFSYKGYLFKDGMITLQNGDEALAFTRMRKKDPDGDFGRQERQRRVITSMMDELASFTSITKVKGLLDIVSNNVATNMKLDRMLSIQRHFASTRKNTEKLSLNGTGQTIDGLWYYIVSEEERNRVSSILKNHLQSP